MRNRPDAIEISVREASYRLGLTQRQVRNYIQARKIAAIKVGKEWFVDVASVQAFAQSHRLDIEKKVLADSQSEADHFFANEPTSQRANEPTSHLSQLRCYQIAQSIFDSGRWINSINEAPHLEKLKHKVLASLGAGFYSFQFEHKYKHYNGARETVGALVALLLANKRISSTWKDEISHLTDDLLPALASLIRKIEKRCK